MIVKFIPEDDKGDGGKFVIVMEQDVMSSLIADYARSMDLEGEFYPDVWEILTRANFLYYCHHGCSICAEIEEYVKLEDTEAPDE